MIAQSTNNPVLEHVRLLKKKLSQQSKNIVYLKSQLQTRDKAFRQTIEQFQIHQSRILRRLHKLQQINIKYIRDYLEMKQQMHLDDFNPIIPLLQDKNSHQNFMIQKLASARGKQLMQQKINLFTEEKHMVENCCNLMREYMTERKVDYETALTNIMQIRKAKLKDCKNLDSFRKNKDQAKVVDSLKSKIAELDKAVKAEGIVPGKQMGKQTIQGLNIVTLFHLRRDIQQELARLDPNRNQGELTLDQSIKEQTVFAKIIQELMQTDITQTPSVQLFTEAASNYLEKKLAELSENCGPQFINQQVQKAYKEAMAIEKAERTQQLSRKMWRMEEQGQFRQFGRQRPSGYDRPSGFGGNVRQTGQFEQPEDYQGEHGLSNQFQQNRHVVGDQSLGFFQQFGEQNQQYYNDQLFNNNPSNNFQNPSNHLFTQNQFNPNYQGNQYFNQNETNRIFDPNNPNSTYNIYDPNSPNQQYYSNQQFSPDQQYNSNLMVDPRNPGSVDINKQRYMMKQGNQLPDQKSEESEFLLNDSLRLRQKARTSIMGSSNQEQQKQLSLFSTDFRGGKISAKRRGSKISNALQTSLNKSFFQQQQRSRDVMINKQDGEIKQHEEVIDKLITFIKKQFKQRKVDDIGGDDPEQLIGYYFQVNQKKYVDIKEEMESLQGLASNKQKQIAKLSDSVRAYAAQNQSLRLKLDLQKLQIQALSQIYQNIRASTIEFHILTSRTQDLVKLSLQTLFNTCMNKITPQSMIEQLQRIIDLIKINMATKKSITYQLTIHQYIDHQQEQVKRKFQLRARDTSRMKKQKKTIVMTQPIEKENSEIQIISDQLQEVPNIQLVQEMEEITSQIIQQSFHTNKIEEVEQKQKQNTPIETPRQSEKSCSIIAQSNHSIREMQKNSQLSESEGFDEEFIVEMNEKIQEIKETKLGEELDLCQMYAKYKQAVDCLERSERLNKQSQMKYQQFIKSLKEKGAWDSPQALQQKLFYMQRVIVTQNQLLQNQRLQYENTILKQVQQSQLLAQDVIKKIRLKRRQTKA